MKTIFLSLVSLFVVSAQAGEFKILPIKQHLSGVMGHITKVEQLHENHTFLQSMVGGSVTIAPESGKIFLAYYCPPNAMCIQAMLSFNIDSAYMNRSGTMVYSGSSLNTVVTVYDHTLSMLQKNKKSDLIIFYTTKTDNENETSVLLADKIFIK